MSLAEAGSAVEDELRRRVAKLERINASLMTHVERVTDQHEGAYSLFQTAIMLDGRVRSRTEELTGLMHRLERSNEALEAAKNEAERANRSKTRFLAAASHDLLQPLNAARLSTSTLADARLEPATAAVVRRVERGLETIEDLIKTLLDISKLDAGIVEPHRGPVRLRDLLAEVEAGFRLQAETKGLRLRIRCAADLVVESDVRLLKRIVGNLVSNAVRYTERGGVLVAARRSGGACRLDVIDTGHGIPAAEHELVFEEFFRGRSSGDAESGLGLGLSIVRRMAETLGHELAFTSGVARGSWFRLALPLSRHLPPQAVREAPAIATSLAGVRVLVVENDAPTLEATARLLEGWGMAVLAVADPRAIVAGIEETVPLDVVLADYHLGPDLVGTDVVAALRRLAGRAIPAIVVTADHTVDVEAKVAASGCGLVHKPIKPAQLRSLLSYVIG